MPIYEYECSGGHCFEKYRQIHNRHDATCPECNQPSRIKISPVRYRLAMPLPVYDWRGQKMAEFRDVPAFRPPTPPEELVRIGELNNSGSRQLR